MAQTATVAPSGAAPVNASRLFAASCVALVSGAAMFAITADIMGALKRDFVLNNEQVGWIMSGGTWGFTLSIFILGPLCDAIGMRRLMGLAFVSHAAGVLMMVFATGFWSLFFGMLVNAVGSGAVEAGCNPLIATLYPDRKTQKLNQFHMWFPGGIVLGGVACYLMAAAGYDVWQAKLALTLVPTAAYGVLFIGQKFPATERVQEGVSFGGMVRETLLRPLFWVLMVCMALTASLELGPARWIPSVLQAGGIPGILVLVWITGLMAVLRLAAGPVVKFFGNTGLLLASAVVSGLGLVALSFGGPVVAVGAAATVFAVGVCYFWPTMLGTMSERVPKGGALALALLGGWGGLVVGVVTTPLMGWVADKYLHRELVEPRTVDGRTVDRQSETAAVLQQVDAAYGRWADSLGQSPRDAVTRTEIEEARQAIQVALTAWKQTGALPDPATAAALRAAIKNGPAAQANAPEAVRAAAEARDRAAAILNPADNKGGLMSFRYVAPLSVVLVVVFGIMHLQDRRRNKAT